MTSEHQHLNKKDIVLIVDDSADIQSFLRDAISSTGAMVLSALSGSQAIDIVHNITPDIILMDGVMPGLDGFETTRKLKENKALSHVPIIFLTGLSDIDDIVKGLSGGGVDYVTKPINLKELIARMKVHLVNARAAQNARTALDTSGQYLFAANNNNQIIWSTPQALRIINYIEKKQSVLNDFYQAMRLFIDKDMLSNGSIDLALDLNYIKISHLFQSSNEYIFRLSLVKESDTEKLRRHFSLTVREAEICQWLGFGKSNKDIGEILDLSPRTVNKHLESIFIKLGTENRTSAATLIIRTLMSEKNEE